MQGKELFAYSAAMLRRELSARGHAWALAEQRMHELSPGSSPVVMFGCDEAGRHGNFHAASYERICATPELAAAAGLAFFLIFALALTGGACFAFGLS